MFCWVSPTPSHVTRLGRPCPGDMFGWWFPTWGRLHWATNMLAELAQMPMYAHGCLHVCSLLSCTPCEIRACSLRLIVGVFPPWSVHCCDVTHLAGPAAGAFTVVALLQPGGGYLAGRRSQCAMYSLPLSSLCRFSRLQSARRDPAVPCVLCSARTRASASPAHTSRCRVWPLHRVHGLASRAVYKET